MCVRVLSNVFSCVFCRIFFFIRIRIFSISFFIGRTIYLTELCANTLINEFKCNVNGSVRITGKTNTIRKMYVCSHSTQFINWFSPLRFVFIFVYYITFHPWCLANASTAHTQAVYEHKCTPSHHADMENVQ